MLAPGAGIRLSGSAAGWSSSTLEPGPPFMGVHGDDFSYVTTVGRDQAKPVFHVQAIDASGRLIFAGAVRRGKLARSSPQASCGAICEAAARCFTIY